MILLTTFYDDADFGRRAELLDCLNRNFDNAPFGEIHVFIEDPGTPAELGSATLATSKVHLIQYGRRVTYRDFFDYANRNLAGQRVVIANADIFFDHTLSLLERFDLVGKLLCLSRWDVQPNGSTRFFEHAGSQDAWVFQAPIRSFYCNFNLGVLGCDNRLAWEAEHAGLKISNPSRSVHANHLHLSQVRRYTELQRLAGPTESVPPVFLETVYPSGRGPAPDASCARVAFRETMGFTISRLEVGVSSHNNESRPFSFIPEPLAGLPFTQVVSCAVSPIEVEFLSSGKVYVLVGNDWEGHQPATDWLNDAGFKENLPLVEVHQKTGFEVWSLVADAGDCLVLPTQVMLVADQLVRNDGPPRHYRPTSKRLQSRIREPIFALTSLSPQPQTARLAAECIESWRRAGLEVRAFNHPSEIPGLATLFDVEFVPTEETSQHIFGRHFIPIKTMLDWAAKEDAPALLINSDIRLQLEPWEMKRLRWLSHGGLCYFVRYNHDGNYARAAREPYGIDAFLLHGRDASLFPDSFLSMGQPFWDYWIPHTFASHNRPICGVEFPAAFHRNHRQSWSWENWHRCALEFNRITAQFDEDQPFEAAVAMSVRVRHHFEQQRMAVAQRPGSIREWVQRTFSYQGAKTFLELGAHQGTDTLWMAEIPDVTIQAFEPDPRNHPPAKPNVTVHRSAIGDSDGPGFLILSQQGWGREWTHSSSLKQPLNHLARFPVTFGAAIEVQVTTLDRFCENHGLGLIDFIWADIQGAEGDMIRGGRETLARTRYLYTEYSDDELYENQATLQEILQMLPDFRVIELWSDDVLLENQKLKA